MPPKSRQIGNRRVRLATKRWKLLGRNGRCWKLLLVYSSQFSVYLPTKGLEVSTWTTTEAATCAGSNQLRLITFLGEVIAIGLEAIALRLEAIAIGNSKSFV